MEQHLARIVEVLQSMRPVRILLFGSAARGEADELSDLDIIMVADNVAPRFVDRIGDALALIPVGIAVDILVYTPDEYARMQSDENPLIERAEQEGRVLYERPAA